jgi:protocatechuate 3,4-dioxygenase beta subunit
MLIDELPLPKEKRLGRRFDAVQHSALIAGKVVDQAGVPVDRGTVVLWRDGRGTPHPFTEGRYSAAVAVAGKYRIELRSAGFAKTSQELMVDPAQVYRIDMTLKPGGVIKGRVVDANGRPASDGDVFYRDGAMSYGVPVEHDGTYRIEGLAPGQYPVSYTQGEKRVSRVGQVVAGKETIMDFVAP